MTNTNTNHNAERIENADYAARADMLLQLAMYRRSVSK